MKDHTRQLLEKAVDSIEVAKILVHHGKSDVAWGQAYYAMFNVAEALLNEKGLKTKERDAKFHRWLYHRMMHTIDKRLAGDFGVETDIERNVSTHMINQAREFLEGAQEYLGK